MIPQQITSLQHPLIKRCVKLRDDRFFRLEEKRVILMGKTLIEDVANHLPLKILISTEPVQISAEKLYLGSTQVLRKIINYPIEDLVVAEMELPEPSTLEKSDTILVLDGLQDPGNVGTILRTALALGWSGAFLTPHTADPFNDKALRASRGAPLFLPLRQGNWNDLTQLIHQKKMSCYIADVKGENLSKISFKKPLVLVMGHETKGPSTHAKSIGKSVSIPMSPKMESLNVASAAAIFMYQIQRMHYE